MNEYRVERINHNQRHLFADLFNQYNRCETAHEKMLTNHLTEKNNSEPVLFIVLTNYPGQIPVGFLQLYSIRSSANAIHATIVHDLYVLPEYRKNGIGLRLIEVAVRFAIDNKSPLIQLETVQDNLIAQKLFESVGFKSQSPASELNVYSIQFAYA